MQVCPGGSYVFDPVIKRCVAYESSSCCKLHTIPIVRIEIVKRKSNHYLYLDAAAESTTVAVGTTQILPGGTTNTNSNTKFTCPTLEGFYAIPDTCSSDYYVCVSGSPYVSVIKTCTLIYGTKRISYNFLFVIPLYQTCPNESIFDPQTLICTSPDQASCRNYIFFFIMVYH